MKNILLIFIFLIQISLFLGQEHFTCPIGYKKECKRKYPERHYFCKCIEETDSKNK